MTEREMSILADCIAVMVIMLVIGFIIGVKMPRPLVREKTMTEKWFRERSAEIYTLAMDYTEKKERQTLKELKLRIRKYNHEAWKVDKWTYRCPPSFSLEYLEIREEK